MEVLFAAFIAFLMVIGFGPLGFLGGIVLIVYAVTQSSNQRPSRSTSGQRIITIRPKQQLPNQQMSASDILMKEAYNKGLELKSERCPTCGLESFSLDGMPSIDIGALEQQSMQDLPEHVLQSLPEYSTSQYEE